MSAVTREEAAGLPSVGQAGAANWVLAAAGFAVMTLLMHAVVLHGNRMIEGVDLRTHYQWAYQFSQALADGIVYPRWMPLANGGLGEPSFVIVHPGYYYLVSALNRLGGGDLWLAMKLAAMLSTFLIGVFGYRFLLRLLAPRAALIGALSLQTMPFALFLFTHHAAMPWQFSFALMIPVLHYSLHERHERVSLALAAFVALLCITHLLVGFMTMFCLGIAGAIAALRTGQRRQWAAYARWLFACLLGVALVAGYVLLAATSPSLFSAETGADDHYLNWRNSFLFPLFSAQVHGMRWFAVQWVLASVPLLGCIAVGWALYAARGCQDPGLRIARALLATAAVSLLLGSELTYPLWNSVPFITLVQWPYRYLTVATMCAGLALVIVLGMHQEAPPRSLWPKSALTVAAAANLIVLVLLQIMIVRDGEDPGLGPKTVSGLFAQRGAEPAAIGPNWKEYLKSGGLDGQCAELQLKCRLDVATAHARSWTIEVPAPTSVVLPVFAFPAWALMVDSRPVEAQTDSATGLVRVALKAGTRTVDLRWHDLWQQRVGSAISLAAAVLWLGWLLARHRRRSR